MLPKPIFPDPLVKVYFNSLLGWWWHSGSDTWLWCERPGFRSTV